MCDLCKSARDDTNRTSWTKQRPSKVLLAPTPKHPDAHAQESSLPLQHRLCLPLVTGCPHPVPPKHAWVQRRGDRAVVKCNHTTETFYLTCRRHEWVGSVSNCTKGAHAHTRTRTHTSTSTQTHMSHTHTGTQSYTPRTLVYRHTRAFGYTSTHSTQHALFTQRAAASLHSKNQCRET